MSLLFAQICARVHAPAHLLARLYIAEVFFLSVDHFIAPRSGAPAAYTRAA